MYGKKRLLGQVCRVSGLFLSGVAYGALPSTSIYYSNANGKAYPSVQLACAAVVAGWNVDYQHMSRVFSVVSASAVSSYSKLGAGSSKNEGSVNCKIKYADLGPSGGSGSDDYEIGTWEQFIPGIDPARMYKSRDADDYVRFKCYSGFVERFGQCVDAGEVDSVQADYKNSADSSGVCPLGNPINPATGAKYLQEADYVGASAVVPLRFERRYNSKTDGITPSVGLGWGWRHTYSRGLVVDNADDLPRIRVVRPDGGTVVFSQQADGTYSQDTDVNDRLVALKSAGIITGYKFTQADGPEGVGAIESYDASGRLQGIQTAGGWQHTMEWSAADVPAEIAPGEGYLIGVIDSSGRKLTFRYNEGGQLKEFKDPADRPYVYQYDDDNNLVSVQDPSGFVRRYHYNEGDRVQSDGGAYGDEGSKGHLEHALTGVSHEHDGVISRFADYRYQHDGRAVETTHASGADKHNLTFNGDGSTTVVDPLGQERLYKFAVAQGVAQPQDQDVPCSTGSPYKSVKSDPNGNPEYQVDFNGNRTNYVYDTGRNLETKRVEGLTAAGAATTATRTVTTQWHGSLRLPVTIAEPLKLTTLAYHPNGTLKSRKEQATTDATGALGLGAALDTSVLARIWTYNYNSNGQVTDTDGPRGDVNDKVTLEYYSADDMASPAKWRKGDLKQVTNAQGHVTTYEEYDAAGNVAQVRDANGLITRNEYDSLGRLKTQTVGGLTTSMDYHPDGLLKSIVQSDGNTLTYGYDDARRLTSVTDKLGNRVVYTLDAMGNREQEIVYDAGGQIIRQRARVYNKLNRLEQDIGGHSAATQVTRYDYDLGGNLKKITDPLSRVTEHSFDALNRLQEITQPAPEVSVPRPKLVYGYNGQDQLTSVTDPRNLATTYSIDGLGNRTKTASPDAGEERYTFDAAGNIKTRQDAKGQISTYSYDALNRLTQVVYHDGSKTLYQYDMGANAKGRLNRVQDLNASGTETTRLDTSYDNLGRVSKHTRVAAGKSYETGYDYDSVGRLGTLTYPSGRTVKYSYDGMGRINEVRTAEAGKPEQPLTVVSGVQYHPFGGVSQFTYGNGQVHKRGQDKDGRSNSYTLGEATYVIDYDDVNQIKAIRNAADVVQTNSYDYDGLGRLKTVALPATTYGYNYDAVGNRTKFSAGAADVVYGYPVVSNRLTTVGAQTQAFDANGSVQSGGMGTLTHDAKGRLSKHEGAGGVTNYVVDGQGLRVRKINAQGDVVYVYDQGGQLIAESTAESATVRKEYIYLGSLPVAVVAE